MNNSGVWHPLATSQKINKPIKQNDKLEAPNNEQTEISKCEIGLDCTHRVLKQNVPSKMQIPR